MDNIYNINGTLYVHPLVDLMHKSFEIVNRYVGEKFSDSFANKMMGIYDKRDIVGDIRRAIVFLLMVSKEMMFDRSIGVNNLNRYYIEKYDTEKYRDYLVCRGVDSQIIDELFTLHSLYYNDPLPDLGTGTSTSLATGIGNMSIEHSVIPFKIS